MPTSQQQSTTTAHCPTCGTPLQVEGNLLRCEQHGTFFRYGPRLLVHIAAEGAYREPLMPWQTLQERVAR